jgi:GNAT superfamily N-acetyltransferase
MILRKAIQTEVPTIWTILQDAIAQRKQDGSQQWQNGYPNEQSVIEDIEKDCAYVLTDGATIVAYAAIIFDIEPAYNTIDGKWLTDADYVVVHRVATANQAKGKGIATKLFKLIEDIALAKNVFSIKVDTNFDNIPMLKILKNLNYTYCGEVILKGAPRKAFEKVLSTSQNRD